MNITMTMPNSSNLVLNSTTAYSNDLDFHIADEWDCDMECIWDRYRKSRTSILRPLTLILSIIGIVGILGNTLVIIVFSRTVQKRTSTYLVLMLAIIDLIACSVVIPGTLFKEWLFEFKSDLVCKLWELMRHFAIISSAIILAAIAFDRFLLVYWRRQDGNKHLTMAMILVAVLSSIAMGVPPMLGVGVYMELGNSNGGLINIKVCMPNDQYISAEGLLIYWQIVTALFGVLILTIVIFYMLIFAMVYRHSARIYNNSVNQSTGQASALSKTQKQSINVLPFIGLPKSEQQTVFKINTSKTPKTTFLPTTLVKLRNIFLRQNKNSATANSNIIAIKVIQNSASSVSSLSQNEVNNFPSKKPTPDLEQQGTSKTMWEPVASKTAWQLKQGHKYGGGSILPAVDKSHDQISQKAPQSTFKQPTHDATAKSTNHSQYQQMRNQSAHVKTTQVLCIITTVYIISFLPMFLITHQVMGENVIIFYLYFINNAANPIIYSFMNKKFRQDICKMFSCRSNRIWTG